MALFLRIFDARSNVLCYALHDGMVGAFSSSYIVAARVIAVGSKAMDGWITNGSL